LLEFELYRSTDLEAWIQSKYEQDGIQKPSDMSDLDRIASLFGAHIAYTGGETKVIYDEEGDCMIFLNIHLDEYERRTAFFHELCHPAIHAGNQRSLPPAFVSLQETQAALFQQYAALPVYLLKSFAADFAQPPDVRAIADAFRLPAAFVRSRLERIVRRIEREREDRKLRERLAPAPASGAYSESTLKLLERLQRKAARKSAGSVQSITEGGREQR